MYVLVYYMHTVNTRYANEADVHLKLHFDDWFYGNTIITGLISDCATSGDRIAEDRIWDGD